nr:Fanconi anemia group A protein-like isoform X3 [Chelonoidis abingdonii]
MNGMYTFQVNTNDINNIQPFSLVAPSVPAVLFTHGSHLHQISTKARDRGSKIFGMEPGDPQMLGRARHILASSLSLSRESLTPCFHQNLFNREQTFLYVAVDMYTQLLRLYIEGENSQRSDHGGQSLHSVKHVDSLEVITKARRFLLHSIAQCPKKSFIHIQQLLDPCEEFDPELKAALFHSSKLTVAEDFYDEPVLF